jgi:hypothetical protein
MPGGLRQSRINPMENGAKTAYTDFTRAERTLLTIENKRFSTGGRPTRILMRPLRSTRMNARDCLTERSTGRLSTPMGSAIGQSSAMIFLR